MNKTFLVFLTTGVLGSFTTFSTIIIDVFILFNEQIIFAFIYLIITLLGGLTFALLGLLIGQRI